MAQNTATVSSDNLFVYNPKSFVATENNELAARISGELQGEIDFIHSSVVFFYNSRLRLKISAKELSPTSFVLLKGLLEFHRSKDIAFTFDKAEKTIEADLHAKEYEQVKSFLKLISNVFYKELKFRNELKNVLAFEARYKAERALAYASLLK
jgi:hypothetical protein